VVDSKTRRTVEEAVKQMLCGEDTMLRALTVLVVASVCGCNNATDRPKQPAPDNQPKGAKVKPMDRPFMEHPSGEFETAVDAMADAIKRLRGLPEWDKWITFEAQGMGPRVDTYHFAAIRMRHGDIMFMLQTNTLAWTERKLELDISAVTMQAGVPESCLSKTESGYSVAKATPIQAARIMDAIFRQYLGIRPHTGEGNDYAIGAEW
jgi:hypothetical protein